MFNLKLMLMFKKEYRAFSYNEAVELANLDGFTVMKNKTVAWENAGRPENTELKDFSTTTLDNLKLTESGSGFMIVVNKGVRDGKVRPYEIKNMPASGFTKFVTKHEVCRTDNGLVVASADNKGDGMKLLKNKVAELKTDCTLRKVKRPVQNDCEAIGKYTPSSKTNLGTYWFIGNEIDTF